MDKEIKAFDNPAASGTLPFRKGDVVFNTDTREVGIVDEISDGCLMVAVRYTESGDLVSEKVGMPAGNCHPASSEEKRRLQRLLSRARLQWDLRKNCLLRQEYTPRDGQLVRLGLLGKRVALGSFKEIAGDGSLVMYCVKPEGKPMRHSMHEVMGAAEDFQITPINTLDRKYFNACLKEKGIAWNGHRRCVESAEHPVLKDGAYFYLNEFFEIVKVQDTYKAKDRKRRDSGNYFTSFEQARLFRECMLSVLRMTGPGDR